MGMEGEKGSFHYTLHTSGLKFPTFIYINTKNDDRSPCLKPSRHYSWHEKMFRIFCYVKKRRSQNHMFCFWRTRTQAVRKSLNGFSLSANLVSGILDDFK